MPVLRIDPVSLWKLVYLIILIFCLTQQIFSRSWLSWHTNVGSGILGQRKNLISRAWKNALTHQLWIMQFTFSCCCFALKKHNSFPLPSLLKLPKKQAGNCVNMFVVTWDESTSVLVLFEAKLNFFTPILTLLPRWKKNKRRNYASLLMTELRFICDVVDINY